MYHLFSLQSKLMMFQNYLWIVLNSNKIVVSWFSGWTKSWPQQVHFWNANSSQVSSFKGNFVPFVLFCYSITALREFWWPWSMRIVFISEFSPRERKSDFHQGIGKIDPAKGDAWEAFPPKPKQSISRINEKSRSL